MKKREYLQKLREYLSYDLPRQQVEKNIDFYSGYIDRETSSGRTVDEVLDELGDPQLIARSIIDAAKSGSDGIPNTEDDVDFTKEIYGNNRGSVYGEDFGSTDGGDYSGSGYGESEDHGGRGRGGFYVYNGGGCLFTLLIMCIVFGFISIFGWMIGLLSPVFLPICIVCLILWLLSRRK